MEINIIIRTSEEEEFGEWMRKHRLVNACRLIKQEDGLNTYTITETAKKGRARRLNYNQIVIWRLRDRLKFTEIAQKAECGLTTVHDAYTNSYYEHSGRISRRLEDLRRHGITKGYLYTVLGDVPGIAESKKEIIAPARYIGELGKNTEEEIIEGYLLALAQDKLL